MQIIIYCFACLGFLTFVSFLFLIFLCFTTPAEKEESHPSQTDDYAEDEEHQTIFMQ